MGNRVQIVLPGLFDLPLGELPPQFLDQRLPRLNRLLRFATPVANRAHSIDAILAEALGWPAQANVGLPLARAFSGEDEREHLLIRPVHLRPDMSSAMVFPIEASAENLADSRRLLEDLGSLFAEDLAISALEDDVFLMRLESCRAPNHYPHVLSVLGKSAKPYIEQSRENLDWYRLLNEMQMFLHQHEINQQRTLGGLLPINSLWCWGGGESRPPFSAPAWYGNDTLLNRFAESLGLKTGTLGEFDPDSATGEVLLVDLRLLEATKTGRAIALDSLLLEIEQEILGVYPEDRRGSTWLRAGFEFDFHLGARDHWKFWRRDKNLADCQREDFES